MVGISANIELPASFYPKQKGRWTVEVIDADHNESMCRTSEVICSYLDGPIEVHVGRLATIRVSPQAGKPDRSLRRALREVFPDAKTPSDIHKMQANFARVYGAWTKQHVTQTGQPLISLQTLAWAAITEAVRGVDSPLSPQPKSQRDARTRPDADRWLKAEEVEMTTCYEKGTFQIVDLPPGVVELLSMFQYKLKTGPNGEVVKFKASLCSRGDMQFYLEFGETFALTSLFSMIRMIIAIAVQAGLTLYQFDIRGAFLCAPIDQEIYLKLPPGYEPLPGKTARLL
eukprot:3937528-Rhodomonas_salina.1